MKRIRFVATVAIAMGCIINFSSCKDELEDSSNTKTQDNKTLCSSAPDKTDSLVVFSFDKFSTPNDVTVASDTSTVCVSNALIQAQNKTITKGMYLDIWRSADEPTFAVKITDIKTGSDATTYSVTKASLKDILPVGSYTLDLSPYYNPDQNLRLANGSINANAYFRASDNTYHPVAYKLVDDGVKNDGITKYVELPYAKWDSPMVEDHTNENWTIGGDFINLDARSSFQVPLGDGAGQIGIDSLHTAAHAGLKLTLDIGWSWSDWFYIDKFEALAYGKVDFGFGASLQFGKKINILDKGIELVTLGHYYATFYVGWIPVTIDCDPHIDLTPTLAVDGKFIFKTSYYCGFDLQAGAGYYHNKGWKNLSHATTHSDFQVVTPILYGSVTANIGLFLCIPFKVYDCVGPSFSAGPEYRNSFTGTYNFDKDEITCTKKSELAIGGKLGMDINAFGWKIAHWELKDDIWKMDLPDEPFDLKKSGDGGETDQMIEAAQADYESHLPWYSVNVNTLRLKSTEMDPSNRYIATLTARPGEIENQNSGHELQERDKVRVFVDFKNIYYLKVVSVEDYNGPYPYWYGGCKVYHLEPATDSDSKRMPF